MLEIALIIPASNEWIIEIYNSLCDAGPALVHHWWGYQCVSCIGGVWTHGVLCITGESGKYRRGPNAVLLLGQRRRRWATIKPALSEHVVFALCISYIWLSPSYTQSYIDIPYLGNILPDINIYLQIMTPQQLHTVFINMIMIPDRYKLVKQSYSLTMPYFKQSYSLTCRISSNPIR